MTTILKNTVWLLFMAFAVVSCSKEKEQGKEINGQCWYKITIEEQTTHPNQFGQDHLIFSSVTGPDGKSGLSLDLIQTKSNGQQYNALKLGSEPSGLFNDKTSMGTTYLVNFFNAIEAHLPDLGEYTYRMENNATPEDGVLTVTVLENSERRMRFKVSGTIMKKEGGVENWSDVVLVPLDAEFSFDRAYYNEMTSNGVDMAGADCDCKP